MPPSPVPPRSPFSANFLPPTPSRNRYASAEPSSPSRPTSSYSTASIRKVTPSPEMEITDAMKEKARGFATEEMARPEAPTPNAAAHHPLRPQSSGCWLGHSRSRHQLYSTGNASTATLDNKESFKHLLATGSATGDDASAAAPVLGSVANGSGKENLPNGKSTRRLDYSKEPGVVKYRLSVNEGSKRIKRAGHGNGSGGYADYADEEYDRPETPTPVSEQERRMMFRPLYIRGRARAEVGELTVKQRVAEKRGEEGLCKGEEHEQRKGTEEQLRETDGDGDHETSGKTCINPDANSNAITDEEGKAQDGREAGSRDLDFTNVTHRRPGRRNNRWKGLMKPAACGCESEGSGETKRGDKDRDEGEQKKDDEKQVGGEAEHNGRATQSEQEEEDEQSHGNGTGDSESNRGGTTEKKKNKAEVKAKKGTQTHGPKLKPSWNFDGLNSARSHRKLRYHYRTGTHESAGKRGSWGEQQGQGQQGMRGKVGDEGHREPGCRIRCTVM